MASSFWTSANIEPKRAFQFKVSIGDIPHFLAMTAGRPSMKIGKYTHNYLNLEFHFPGRISFEPIQLKLVDTIGDNAVQNLKDILLESGYNLFSAPENAGGSGMTYLKTVSRTKAIAALNGTGKSKGMVIEQLNADGKVVEKWTLNNAWISSINFSDLDFSSEDASNIELEITYDYPEIEVTNVDNL